MAAKTEPTTDQQRQVLRLAEVFPNSSPDELEQKLGDDHIGSDYIDRVTNDFDLPAEEREQLREARDRGAIRISDDGTVTIDVEALSESEDEDEDESEEESEEEAGDEDAEDEESEEDEDVPNVDDVDEEVHELIKTVLEAPPGDRRAIMALYKFDYSSASQYADEIGYSPTVVYNAISNFEDTGLIKPREEGSYRRDLDLTDLGKKVLKQIDERADIGIDLYGYVRKKEGSVPSSPESEEADEADESEEDVEDEAPEPEPESEEDVSAEDEDQADDEGYVPVSKRYECRICRNEHGPWNKTSASLREIALHISNTRSGKHRGRDGAEPGLILEHPTKQPESPEPFEGTHETVLPEDLSELQLPSSRVRKKAGNASYTGSESGIDARTPPLQTIQDRPVKATPAAEAGEAGGEREEDAQLVSAELSHPEALALLQGAVPESFRRRLYESLVGVELPSR